MRHLYICVAVVLAACSPAPAEVATRSAPVELEASTTPAPNSSSSRDKTDWRKDRFITVAEAVERLQPHVDVPVVLPRGLGLRNLKGWLADPRYLDWRTVDGTRVGSLTIRKNKQILILSYGLAGFDGCGGRESAIETTVLDQPALVNPSGDRWSTVIWPVTETGATGRYGISGSFEAVSMLRLAESMELARLEAMDVTKNC